MKQVGGCERERVAVSPLAHARGFLQVLTLALAMSAGVGHAAEPVHLTGRAMGTTWSAKWVSPAVPLDASGVEQRIAARLEELENQFSTYRAGSELSRFNASRGTEWFPVSAELARVALEARAISAATAGAFDVTVDPLVRLWGFGPAGRPRVIPAVTAIAEARARVGWRRLEARSDPPALRRTSGGVTADFSSIAKGFASDALSAMLVELGAVDHLVQVGGDLRASGRDAGGGPWRAGIETPTDERSRVALVVSLREQALSTSGDYRNFFLHEGRRYGHVIDPRTGWPVSGRLASVSVVHSSCAASSAWATALFALGADDGFALAKRLRLACVFFVRDPTGPGFTRRATPAFESLAP